MTIDEYRARAQVPAMNGTYARWRRDTCHLCCSPLRTRRRPDRAEHDRMELLVGEDVADAWEDGLMDAIASLATLPLRCAVAAENDCSRVSARPSLATTSLPAYTHRPDVAHPFQRPRADDQDLPTVLVHRVQHRAQAPLTEWGADAE